MGGPQRLGRYTLLEELAQGGMSRVFVAQKDGADGICVLKQLLVELKTNEVASKRFYREAHIASFLDHPHIARLLDAGFEDDSFCLAVEFIAGSDLESIMRKLDGKTMAWELAVAIAVFVLDALAYAHEALDPEGKRLYVVHRDIAPRNVMVGFNGGVKLIDFGLARGKLGDFETEPGIIVGTLRYLSPEQARSEEVDRRSDIYSLGVVLHELLTGQKLVQEKTPLAALKAIMDQSPPLMRTVNARVPTGIEIAVARALEKLPGDRWQTAGEFRDALIEVVGSGFARSQVGALGELVRNLFPEGERRASVLSELGRHRFASMYGHSDHYGGTLSEAATRDQLPQFKLRSAHEARNASSPWSRHDPQQQTPIAHQQLQLDAQGLEAETSPAIPREEIDSARLEAPTIPPVNTPNPTASTAPNRPSIDVVEADTIRVPYPRPASLAQDAKVTITGEESPDETLEGRPPGPATSKATLAKTLEVHPRSQQSDPELDRLRERARALINDPAGVGDPEPLDDDTAVSAHPLVRRRAQRNRLLFFILIGGVLGMLAFFLMTMDQCGTLR